ncbi:MAG TPA: AAA family ATPase [Chthoniobacteraceae bacterium]|nr:AAA family ATPase [Chthoniobacteraceae bacterium]
MRLIESHASYLVLAARHAYKVKKSVNFGFLDFSTLAKRHYFCRREVTLNRRLSEGVYLGVVPISIANGRLAFGNAGRIVEYAVKMRRLSERYFMKRLLRSGKVTSEHMDALVALLTDFYKHAASDPKVAQWGRLSRVRISTNENFQQLRPFIGATISRPAWEAIRGYTDRFYRNHATLLASRVSKGRVRDCHGDLHLEHIHLAPAHLVVFDCIEFNDRFRYIDVANDVAFLAMDLEFYGRRDLARQFARKIAGALNDPQMLQLLTFYKCYRACVRGKVESLRSAGPAVAAGERVKSTAWAKSYIELALNYAIAGASPMAIVLSGPVASGKSALATRLSAELGWEQLSSDRVRKELAHVPLHGRGTPSQRRKLYADEMTKRTYAELSQRAVEKLREGKGVVLDATFGNSKYRDDLRALLGRIGSDYCFLALQTSRPVIKRRLAARTHSTTEISDARLDDFPELITRYNPPGEVPRSHRLRVSTKDDVETTMSIILRGLAERKAERLHVSHSSA